MSIARVLRLAPGVFAASLVVLGATNTSAGTVSIVDPGRVSSDATLSVTGTGFDAAAGNNQFAFTPEGGTAVLVMASSVATVDAAKGVRRLAVRVPSGLPAGRAAVRITNLTTGEQTDAGFIEIVATQVSPASARPGAGPLTVVIAASANARFSTTGLRVAFGTGISVTGVTVDSPTRLSVTIVVSPVATPGPRSVSTLAAGQTTVLMNGFTVLSADDPGPTNAAPVFTSTPPLTATVGTPYAYTATATDADGDPVLFVLVSGPAGFAIAPNGVVSWTPTASQMGAQAITIEARDGKGGNTAQSFTVTVSETSPPPPPPTNTAPVFTSTPPLTATVGTPYAYTATATDADGDPVLFVLVSGPAGFSIAPNGVVSWTPTASQMGAQAITIEARDGKGGNTAQSFTVTVSETSPPPPPPTNTAPVFTSTPPLTATVGTAYAYTATATDADGDPVLFVLVSAPTGFAIAPSGVVSWTPTASQMGAQAVTIEARDGKGGNTAQSFTVTVSETSPPPPPTNQAPTVQMAPVAPVTLPAGTTVSATVTDDGLPNPPGVVTLAWSQVSGPTGGTAIFVAGGAATTEVTFSAAGTYVLRLTADDSALSASADVTVTVNPASPTNTSPTVNAGPDQAVTLPAAALLTGTVTDDGLPPGAPLTIGWSKVAGPGTVTFANATSAATSATFSEPGVYTLRLTASDTQFTVSDDVSITVNEPSLTNLAPSVDAGPDAFGEVGVPIDLAGAATDDGRVSATPALAWAKLAGPGVVSFASPGSAQTTATFDAPGVYVLQLSADDGEFVSADTMSVTVVATATSVTDRAPPLVTLMAPREAVPGAEVEVRAEASDNVGVVAVRFEIDDQPPTDVSIAPFTMRFTVPEVVAPGAIVSITASARDAAGNAGRDSAQLTITSSPDTELPAVQISGPQSTSPGAVIRLTATATDNVGVDEVTFLIGGQPIGSGRVSPYRASYLVPGDAPAGSALTFTARARDFSGNEAESVLQVLVETVADTTPPTVSLDVPAETFPGALLPVTATASDAGGIASVDFTVDEAQVATLTAPPYSTSYRVPAGQQPGTALTIVATATDYASFTATAAGSVRVVAPPLVTRGVVTGEVYDDRTGLPLAGARVVMEGLDAAGVPFADETITDARGRYLLRGSTGEARLRITRAGFTRVDRQVRVEGGQAVAAFDARLTPVAAMAGRVSLTMLAGSLPGGLTLVPVSGQGLQGLLPLGWSPVGVADLWPHTASLNGAATLRVANVFGLIGSTPLVLVRFDEAAGAWRALGAAGVSSNGQWLEATVSATGQYAFLVADVQPQAPPPAVAGQLLGGVDRAALPATLSTAIEPEPRILFYAPDVFSTVIGRATAPTPITSGVPIVARFTESYRFVSGAELHPEPYESDLVFYQAHGAGGATATQVETGFVASPSQAFDPLSLERGVITVELVADGAGAAPRGLVTSGGGVVDGPGGLQLTVPAGAVSDPTPLTLAPLSASPVPLPSSLAFVTGASLQIDRALARGGVLSLPAPPGLTDVSRLLLVRLAAIGGQTRLLLTGVARLEGGRLVADTRVAGQATALEGIVEPGQYLLLNVDGPIGFVGGLVRGVENAPFAGALVTSDSLPVVSRSNGLGAYLAVGRVGTVTFTARDLAKNDTGSAQAFVIVSQVQALALRLVAVPPQVTSITPANGATGVALGTPVVVTFSEPIDPASVSGANLANVVLRTAGGDPVAGVVSLSSNNATLTFRPSDALASDTTYTFVVTTGVRDMAGYGVPAPVSVTFETLDTTPPPTPAAGSITAGIPNAQGQVVVSATQGTAGPRDRVFVDNLTRRTTAVALVNPNGSFSTAIVAGLTDKLRVRIIDESGNEAVQELAEFKQTNPDGSVSQVVGADGGVVDGPEGSRATIRPGTFPDGAVVTLRAVPASAFPKPLTPEQAERIEFESGVAIDFGGAEPTTYVNVGVAPRGGETERDRWVLVQFAEDDTGAPRYEAVDTARIIDGRITTSSPPCPGVTAAGTYGFMKPKFDQVGVNWARVNPDVGSITVDIFNVFGSTLLRMPWDVKIDPFKPTACFPALTSDVTITANTAILTVPGSELTPSDREIVVQSSVGRQSFPRNYPEFVLDVDGTVRDDYSLLARGFRAARGADGEQVEEERVLGAFTVTELSTTRVRLRVDPDRVKMVVTEIVVANISRNTRTTFPIQSQNVELPVTGAPDGNYTVTARDADGLGREVQGSSVRPSPFGTGNLLARARAGSIDPTREEMNQAGVSGPARTGLVLTGPEVFVDLHGDVIDGGFDKAFSGDPDVPYALTISYDTRPSFQIELPRFRVVVRSTFTGRVVRTIEAFMPPPDEPRALGDLTDDRIPPYVISGPTKLQSFDPSGTLTFTFSEAMDPESLRNAVVVLDGEGRRLAGRVQVSGGGRVVTFFPEGGLQLGKEYTITVSEQALDRAGNPAVPVTLRIRTFTPRAVSSVVTGHPFKDVALRRKTVNERVTTTALATTGAGATGASLVAIDVTNVLAPVLIGGAEFTAPSRQRIVLVPDVEPFAVRNGGQVGGDVVVTTLFNVNASEMTFYDVTDPEALTFLGRKVLTVNPDLAMGASQFNTTFATGFARGVAALRTDRGLAAYAAVERVGLMATEVWNNIPTRTAGERIKEGLLPGDFVDLTTYHATLVAVSPRNRVVTLVDPNLAPLGSVPFAAVPNRGVVVEGLAFDANNDGFIDPEDVYDLAVVAASDGVHVVDIRDVTAPKTLGFVRLPGNVREVDADAARRRVFVAYDDPELGPALGMVDLTDPTRRGLVDVDNDGIDDRLIWRTPFPKGVNGLRFEPQRGLLYVSTPADLEIWAVYDICCDLGVDLEAIRTTRLVGETDRILKAEQVALKRGIKQGLDQASAQCGLGRNEILMFESGSSACIWDSNPAETCNGNYQPGVSDHDISVFFADRLFPAGVKCTLERLTEQFTDQNGEAVPYVVDGLTVRFEDIAFLENRLSWWRTSMYGLDRTDPDIPGDPDNTLGLAHQFLLLKHATEARWVDVDGWTLKDPNVDFEDALRKMRNATLDWVRGGEQRPEAMSPVEAYETANLMEFNLYKGKIYVRIKGATSERSAFNGFLIKQLHNAGKAGIRATLAKMIADPRGRERLLSITRRGAEASDRQYYLFPDLQLLTFESNACLTIDAAKPVHEWRSKPCGSLEEYVASAAARTRLPWGDQPPLDLFSEQEVKLVIPRFFRVKADLEVIDSDAKADEFLAMTHRWVQRMIAETEASYTEAIGNDNAIDHDGTPRRQKRIDNLAYKQQRIIVKKQQASFDIVPRVYNRGFTDAANVKVAMYTAEADGPYTKKTEETVFLSGGTQQALKYRRLASGELERDDRNQPVGIFKVKDIDQTQSAGETRRVVFTIDLPDRTAKEGYRENNVQGFFWYLLETATGETPSTAATVPPPFSPAQLASLLAPDPECVADPRLTIDQYITYQGSRQPNPAFILVGEPATYTMQVSKPGIGAASSVTACETLTGKCASLGTVATLLPKSFTRQVPTDRSLIFDIVPTVYSSTTGVQRGSPLRVVISCERYSLTALAPASPREFSVIMQGGRSYRYFQVTDRLVKGPPASPVSATLTLTGPGGVRYSHSFTTNDKGHLGRMNGERFEPGVSFVFDDSMPAGLYEARVELAAGGARYCGATATYYIEALPFSYTEAMQAGAAASLGLGNPFKGKLRFVDPEFRGRAGGGLSFTLDVSRLAGERTDKAFEVGRFVTAGLFASGRIEADLAAARQGNATNPQNRTAVRNRGKVRPWRTSATADGASADLEASFELLHGDAHRFGLPVDANGAKALSALVLDTALQTAPGVPGIIAREFLKVLRQRVAGIVLPKVSENILARMRFSADGQIAGIEMVFAKLNDQTQAHTTRAQVKSKALSFGIKADAALEWERRFADENTPIGNIVGLRTEGEFSWTLPFETSLQGAKDEVDAGPDDVTTKGLKKAFLDELQEKLQGVAEGSIGGGVELRLHTDPRKNNAPDALEIRFLGPLAYAYPPAGGGGTNNDTGETTTKSLRFTIDSRAQIGKVLETVTSAGGLLEAGQKTARGIDPEAAIETGPTVIYELLVDFVRRVLDQATYDVPVRKGKETTFDLDLSLLASAAVKAPVKSGLDAQFLHHVNYPLERGRIVGGVQYKLEDYSAVQPGLRDFRKELEDKLRPGIDAVEPDVTRGREKQSGPGDARPDGTRKPPKVWVPDPADPTGEPLVIVEPDDIEVDIDVVDPEEEPPGPTRERPGEIGTPRPEDPPRGPRVRVRNTPDPDPGPDPPGPPPEQDVTIGVKIPVDKLPPGGGDDLRPYRIKRNGDFEPVGPFTHDPIKQTFKGKVRTEGGIIELVVEIVGIPVGPIELEMAGVQRIGSGEDRRTRIRFRSQTIPKNDGKTMIPGDIVHVLSVEPDAIDEGLPIETGTFLTPDAQPAVGGHQAALDAEGRLDFTIEYLGDPGRVRLLAFTKKGVAKVDATFAVPR